MSRLPFPISDSWSDAKGQIEELLRILYEERVGGLKKGDYITGTDEAQLTVAWEDLRVPVNAVRVGADKAPSWTDTDSTGTSVLGFADQGVEANEEIVYFSVQLPHNYKQGTDIYPHIHWWGSSTLANVVWQLNYRWANINDVTPTTAVVKVIASTGGTNNAHLISSFPKIDGRDKTISSMLLCSLRRNSSNASDTFTSGTAYFFEIDFHYQVDSNGSRQEKVK